MKRKNTFLFPCFILSMAGSFLLGLAFPAVPLGWKIVISFFSALLGTANLLFLPEELLFNMKNPIKVGVTPIKEIEADPIASLKNDKLWLEIEALEQEALENQLGEFRVADSLAGY
jgi:hypothetical protein